MQVFRAGRDELTGRVRGLPADLHRLSFAATATTTRAIRTFGAR